MSRTTKKEEPKKEEPKKEKPKKEEPKKEEPKKEEPKKKNKIGETEIYDAWKKAFNPLLRKAYENDDKEEIKKLYMQAEKLILKVYTKYGRSLAWERKQFSKVITGGYLLRSWAKGKKIKKVIVKGVDITDLYNKLA
mgnify:CR=1 FL=1